MLCIFLNIMFSIFLVKNVSYITKSMKSHKQHQYSLSTSMTNHYLSIITNISFITKYQIFHFCNCMCYFLSPTKSWQVVGLFVLTRTFEKLTNLIILPFPILVDTLANTCGLIKENYGAHITVDRYFGRAAH